MLSAVENSIHRCNLGFFTLTCYGIGGTGLKRITKNISLCHDFLCGKNVNEWNQNEEEIQPVDHNLRKFSITEVHYYIQSPRPTPYPGEEIFIILAAPYTGKKTLH